MRLGKFLTLSPLLGLAAAAGWHGYGALLLAGMPKVEIVEASPLAAQNDKTLPFFELMSPLPEPVSSHAVPKLEYKKGPPDRFIERISVLFQADEKAPKERVTYYGRRTRSDLIGISALPDEPAREAHYLEAALRLSQGENVNSLSGLNGFLFRPFYLREAESLLQGVERVTVMDQAGTPAFLFESVPGDNGRGRASALFARRNSFYRVDYSADRGFSVLDPVSLFRKTFLTENRSDALGYIARNLSEVKLSGEQQKDQAISLRDVAWPALLLAAHVSVDPSSIDTYFHFAGLNTLLYRSGLALGANASDMEITDILRNNVLAADLYARDIAPEAAKTHEIARFSRLLTRNIDE
jgi:hypothetical protein